MALMILQAGVPYQVFYSIRFLYDLRFRSWCYGCLKGLVKENRRLRVRGYYMVESEWLAQLDVGWV